MKFSKEEVNLCKQIAEKRKKPLKLGDWMVVNFTQLRKEEVVLFDSKWAECPNRFPDGSAVYDCSTDYYYKKYFPLWTISDCLEFLEENDFTYTFHFITKKRGYELILFDGHQKRPQIFEGKTRKIPCLKAVLTVLERKEK